MTWMDYISLVLSIGLWIVGAFFGYRWFKNRGKIMIQDQSWGWFRIAIVCIFIVTMFTSFASWSTLTNLDWFRMGGTLAAVIGFTAAHDGVGEEGLVAGGRFYPWNFVRAYDWQEGKSVIEVFFQIESMKKDKPDEYTTKELDFNKSDKEKLMRFFEINLGRKYTRMKKKK